MDDNIKLWDVVDRIDGSCRNLRVVDIKNGMIEAENKNWNCFGPISSYKKIRSGRPPVKCCLCEQKIARKDHEIYTKNWRALNER